MPYKFQTVELRDPVGTLSPHHVLGVRFPGTTTWAPVVIAQVSFGCYKAISLSALPNRIQDDNFSSARAALDSLQRSFEVRQWPTQTLVLALDP